MFFNPEALRTPNRDGFWAQRPYYAGLLGYFEPSGKVEALQQKEREQQVRPASQRGARCHLHPPPKLFICPCVFVSAPSARERPRSSRPLLPVCACQCRRLRRHESRPEPPVASRSPSARVQRQPHPRRGRVDLALGFRV